MVADGSNPATPVRAGEELDWAALDRYLKKELPGLEGEPRVSQFAGGNSNLTYRLQYANDDLVVRRPPFGTKAKTAHDMGREYRVLKALGTVFPYCPRPLAYTEDTAVMDCAFYVMERIQGIILRKDIPSTLKLQPADASRLCENLFRVLHLSLIHISEPTRPNAPSRMPSSA